MSDDHCGQNIVGKYLLEGVVGEGSMGRVYSAHVDGTKVAVKVLHRHLQKSQDFRERFELEAQALSRLSHPSFPRVFDSGHDSHLDVYFIALEFVEGVNGAARMESEISVEEACVIALQVSEALTEAHSQGVLHRDLKPENIMISGGDPPTVKLLDLGLAKLFDTDPDESTDVLKRRRNLTKAGQVFGTPAYMSPEMCLGERDLSVATDLYSLGLILFEMIEGVPPFTGSPIKVSMDQVETPPPRMSETTPVEIARLVDWMLQKTPADRPQSANQVSEVLRKFVPNSVAPTVHVEDVAPVTQPRKWVALLVVAAVVALVMGWLVLR